MPTDTVQLLGAGGHARVVIDALLCCGWPVQRITPRDDRAELAGTLMLGCRIETPVLDQLPPHGQVHAAQDQPPAELDGGVLDADDGGVIGVGQRAGRGQQPFAFWRAARFSRMRER